MGYAHRLEGEHWIKLKDFDPGEDGGLKREEAEKKTAQLIEELTKLQELLYAARRQGVLIILQGRDTSGKDGTIHHVAGPLNSQSCTVTSFKVPTEEELAHDFLWRVHAQTPRRGDIKNFNRSHGKRDRENLEHDSGPVLDRTTPDGLNPYNLLEGTYEMARALGADEALENIIENLARK